MMNNIMESDPPPDSEEDATFGERIICESDVLVTEDENSNEDKSENETHFEYLETQNNSKIHFVSLPVLQETEVKASWSKNMTKALIEEYTIMLEHFRTPERKQKDIWLQLASRMQEKGHHVTWEMCNRKFRNLKQTYRTIYYSDRSEKSKRRWEFYEDLSILNSPFPRFNRNKSMSPPSSPISQENFVNIETRPLSQVLPLNSSTFGQSLNNSPQILHQTNQSITESEKEPPAWFKEFLVQFKVGQENMVQNIRNMHNESKQLELRKIKLLENILTLMNNKNKN